MNNIFIRVNIGFYLDVTSSDGGCVVYWHFTSWEMLLSEIPNISDSQLFTIKLRVQRFFQPQLIVITV